MISNGTLLWQPHVRDALMQADWVSVKVDAAIEPTWRRVNRPHPNLDLAPVHAGIRRFARDFAGTLVSETMRVAGVNDSPECVAAVGRFLGEVGIRTAYLSIPTRPTPYPAITSPGEEAVNRAYQLLTASVPRVEYLIGYEGDAFASSGDSRHDLLAITAVHPMRASTVTDLLERSGDDWTVVEDLIERGEITEVTYEDQRYYLRRWRRTEQG